MKDNLKRNIPIIGFIIAMIVFPLLLQGVMNLREKAVTHFNEQFSGMEYIYMANLLLAIVTGVFILSSIHFIKGVIEGSLKAGLIITIVQLLILLFPLIFNNSGTLGVMQISFEIISSIPFIIGIVTICIFSIYYICKRRKNR